MTESVDPLPRTSLFPDDVEPVQLHRAVEPLVAALVRCRDAGWLTVEVDAAQWSGDGDMHGDLAGALAFPESYGRNLDALVDSLRGLATSKHPALVEASGLALVVHNFDRLAADNPGLANDLSEIFAEGANHALRYGWPIAVLLQSNDGGLRLTPSVPISIPWNRAERHPVDRA